MYLIVLSYTVTAYLDEKSLNILEAYKAEGGRGGGRYRNSRFQAMSAEVVGQFVGKNASQQSFGVNTRGSERRKAESMPQTSQVKH